MSCFPKKLVLSSLRKFSILKPCTNIQLLRGFDLGFWYFRTNLQKTPVCEKALWKVSRFASLSQEKNFLFIGQICRFLALQQYSVTQKIGFRHLTDSKRSSQGTQIQEKSFFRSLNAFFALLEKQFCILIAYFAFLSLALIFNYSEDSPDPFDRLQYTFLNTTFQNFVFNAQRVNVRCNFCYEDFTVFFYDQYILFVFIFLHAFH